MGVGGGNSVGTRGTGGTEGAGGGNLLGPGINDLDGFVLKSGDEFLLKCDSLESTGLLSGNPHLTLTLLNPRKYYS